VPSVNSSTFDAALRGPWRSPRRLPWWLGVALMGLPFYGGFVALAGAGTLGWWLGPLFVYLIIPLLDPLFGTDDGNLADSDVKALETGDAHRWPLYAGVGVQLAALAWGAWYATTHSMATLDWIGLALSTGLVSGAGITAGHELGHSRKRFETLLARIALAPTGYGHFAVEHQRGHHVRVSTPADPASARYGESYWRFLPRTVIGSAVSAWRLEAERLRREGRPVWSASNKNLQGWTLSLVLAAGLVGWLGVAVLPFLLLQAAYGASLLEVINYIEHYGLARQRQPDGRYERCRPAHSWNANHRLSNLLLFNLQRHSDHHAHPTRPYPALRHLDTAPQLPTGYAGMMLAAYLSPLWFRIMNPRVAAHYGGDLSLANNG